MSKKQKKTRPAFSYNPAIDLPKLRSVQTTWDLKRHFYKSEHDPQIRKDIEETKLAYGRFVRKYKKVNFTNSVTALRGALNSYRALLETKGHKPAYYFSYRLHLNAQDHVAEKMLNTIDAELTKLGTTILFFELAIGKIPKTTQRTYLKEKSLAPFHFYLKGIFETARYDLTEPEERILALKAQTSHSMWISGTEKLIGLASVTFEGRKMPLSGALMQFMDLPKKRRHALWKLIVEALEKLGPAAENELNAIITDKKVNDELRGYKKPYSATALSYDQHEASIEALVQAVETRGYALARKFFTHKAKLLGHPLSYIDREDWQSDLPTADFETAVMVCRDAFYGFNSEYGAIFDAMLEEGRIDVYPRQGKGGGAFCSNGINTPTLVLLNHTNDFQSMKTIAHEMGHAIHATRSKQQPALYEDHSIATAETASTFFEAVLGDRLRKVLPESQQATFLNSLINDRISTIVMCVARFKAELEIHERIRKEGALTWQEMSAILRKHFAAYVGPSVQCSPTDGHLIVSKIHYRLNFYQYTYAFGNIASSIMWKRYQQNPAYASKIDSFLSAGRSGDVESLFKSIGIDVSKTRVYEEGLSILENDIKEFIRLTKKP